MTRQRSPRRRLAPVLCLVAALVMSAGLVACGGSDSSDGSGTASATVSAPSITTQPASVSVATGSAATLSVVASGGSLAYQWYKASSAIAGATSATYSITAASSSDQASYEVIVSNSAGSVTSNTAMVTVTASTAAAACDTTYVDALLAAIASFETALGSSLTASTLYDNATYTSAQLNVYKTDWSNLPPGALAFSRPGITLSQLSSSAQIAAFNTLVKTALSSTGYTDYQGVLAADDYLGYTQGASGYGAALYHVALVGTPSETGLWTLMLGGHHMAFNLTFEGGCAYPTPHHIGVEPKAAFTANSATSYSYYDAGTYQVLASKASAMLAVFAGLSSAELQSAFLSGQTFSDILIGPVEASTGSYAAVSTKFSAIAGSSARGQLVSSLSSTQQALVSTALEAYVDDYDSNTASRLLSDYQEGYGSTYVAWANAAGTFSSAGPDTSASGTYLRIDGPRVWIEIAIQAGIVIQSQTHYHMMFRDKSYDYYNELSTD